MRPVAPLKPSPQHLIPSTHPRLGFAELGPSSPAVTDHAGVGVVEIVEAVEEVDARVHERLWPDGIEDQKIRCERIAAASDRECVAGRLDRLLRLESGKGKGKVGAVGQGLLTLAV